MATENAPVNGWYSQDGGTFNSNVTDTFIPEIWTDQLLDDIEDELLLSSATITNRNYDGVFRREGDVVRIPHFVDTVEDKGMVEAYGEIDTPDRAALEYIKMTVNKGSSFHIELDSLHQLQTKAGLDLMQNLVRQRARAAAVSIDRVLALTILAAVDGKDLNGVRDPETDPATLPDLHGKIDEVKESDFPSDRTIGVYDYLVAMIRNLNIKNAPLDRYLFISPNLYSELLLDPKFIDASHFGSGSVMATGVVGQILGLPVRVSNQLGSHTRPATGGPGGNRRKLMRGSHDAFKTVDILMGSTQAASLVIPHAEMKAYQPEKTFTQAIKSRIIYDAKVIRPEQIVVARNVEADIAAHNAAVGSE